MVGITNHLRYELQYYLKNIRALIINTFTAEELQHLCEVTPEFKRVSHNLLQNLSLQEITQELLDYAERQVKVELLLALVKEKNPVKYEAGRPYYASITVSAETTVKGSDTELNHLQAQFSQATFQQKISERLALFVQTLKSIDELLYQAKQDYRLVELLTKEKAAVVSFTVTITGKEVLLKDFSAQLAQESFRQKIFDNLEKLAQIFHQPKDSTG